MWDPHPEPALNPHMGQHGTAYQILRDDAWAHALLVWLVAFNSFAIKPLITAMATLADPTRQDLLQLSRVDARRGAHVQ